MSRIKPFWRIVLGFLIFCVFVYNSNSMIMGEGAAGFAFWGAFLASYVFVAIKVPYDDPLRSMRDLMAEQMGKSQPEEESEERGRVSQLEAELAALRKKLDEISDAGTEK